MEMQTKQQTQEEDAVDDDEIADSNSKSERGSDGEYEPDEASSSSDEHGSDSDYKPDKHASSSGEHDSHSEYLPNEDTEKPKAISFTRRNYCYVCGKGMTKISRHFSLHADEEPDIAKALALPKQSKERKGLLNDLRNRGNYKHNKVVLKTNSGDLKPKRQPRTCEVNSTTYVHCLYCKGFFSRRDMWRHVAKCTKKTHSATHGKKRVLYDIDLAELPLSEKIPSDLQKLILSMPHDEISFIVKHDALLIQLTQYLSETFAGDQTKQKLIRHKLRQMGKFLLALHGTSIFSFEDALKPKNFNKVVETVKGLAGYDKKKQQYKKPSVALTLGHTLKQIANIVVDNNADNEEMVRDAKTFISLCEEEWKGREGRKEDTLTNEPTVETPSTIPFTQDVQALYRCLETTSASATETIKKYESPQVYNAFCRVILAQVFVLNKGAPEVSKMTLKSFQERDDTTQVLSKHFIRINIPNKTGENTAVLLTSKLVNAITLLVSKRMSCGVLKDNVFLFAKPDGSTSSIQYGRTSLKTFSNLCNAKNPEYLWSSRFQKHIARIFQILNLENDELGHLAKLLGHDIRAEKEYYRLPEGAVELAKISKLLLAMEKGSLERFKGNSLDEIEIEDQLEPDVEKASNSKKCDAKEGTSVSEDKPDNRLTPEQDALKHIKACKDKPFLEGTLINPFKGRGVFTHESINPGAFVVEYRGNIYTHKAAQKKTHGDALNNFLFDFSWNGKDWSIDASADDGSLGRLVNDDHTSPNCEMRKAIYEGKPHLCLFALKKILAGEEITYNYGDSSYPWRSTDSSEKQNTSCTAASSPGKERVKDCSSAESDWEGPDNDDPRTDDDFASNNNSEGQESKPSKRHSTKDSSVLQRRDFENHSMKTHSYTNKNYCYVCGKAQAKIGRHLFTHRKEDADIAAVFALPRNSKERKSQLEKLRNRGNWKHNQEVLKTCSGELKVRKKSLANAGKTLAPCIYCKIMCGRREMWKHLKNCSSKFSNPGTATNPRILTWVSAMVKEPHEMSLNVKEMAKTLKEDDVPSVVWSDSYLVHLAEYLCHNVDSKATTFQFARLKLRLMGRLLLLLNKKSVCSFEDAMKPKNFNKVVEAVGELGGFSVDSESCDAPKFVKLVGSLKVIGNIKYAMALKEGADEETIREAETFMALCAKQWTIPAPSQLKIRNAKTIVFTHDVQLFYQLMERTAASGVQSLTMDENPQVYNALSRVTLAQVAIINKNVFDISTVTLQSFNKRQDAKGQGDAAVCQSQFEQILFKRFVKIKVKSKSGKKVSIMLTPEMLSAIILLVKKREVCGVHKSNSFLFARPGTTSSTFYRGKTCVTTLLTWSGAKNLSNLKSPYFRKHMARVFHILSLSNDELHQLSKLLSCDIRTHRDYYQTPEAAVDIAKISQLISAMEKGSIEEFQGKSLGEIELEHELQPDMEQNNAGSSGEEEDDVDPPESPQPCDITKETSITQEKASTSKEDSSFKQFFSSTNKRASSARKRGTEEDVMADKPVKRPIGTPTCSKADAQNVWFSDDEDEDMNVDFDFNIDTDEDVRNEEYDGDGDSAGSAAAPVTKDTLKTKNQNISDCEEKDDSPFEQTSDVEEAMDTDVEERSQKTGGQTDLMDVDDGCSSEVLNSVVEKENKVSAPATRIKELKILIPKLEIEDIEKPVHISQLSFLSKKRPLKDESVLHNNKKCRTSTSTSVNTNTTDAKTIEMTCSHCKKSIMKGQTAFQKKGFTEVFCSKNCLFEMFPMNKATKTCHFCLKEITQILDLIMAVVDTKGTIKDFCSVMCLTSFKSNTQSHSSMFKNTCTEDVNVGSDSTVNTTDDTVPTISPAESSVLCCTCKKKVKKGQKLYRLRNSQDVCCSASCFSERQHDNMTVFSKTCYNCFKLIKRPQNIILAPVDDSGTMRELCSETCLASVKSKRTVTPRPTAPPLLGPPTGCRMCVRYCHCKIKVTLEGVVHSFCSDTCFINYSKANKLPLLTCDICSSFIRDRLVVLKIEGGSKNICSEECLVKFKEKVKTPQLCLMCKTLHQMSDMVEKEDENGSLNIFCSNRCMMVYKDPCFILSDERKPSPQNKDVKELKPLLTNFDCSKVKEEPFDDEYEKDLIPAVQGVKDEPNVAKEDVKNASALSLNGEPTPDPPILKNKELPASCFGCKEVFMNGETVYQKKGHSEIFCSNLCLLKFYQTMPVEKTCHFCLEVITQPQDAVHAQLDAEGTVEDFCSQACLCSFNYKTFVSTKIPIVPVRSYSQCSVCGRYCISKHEVLQQDVVNKMCSDSCYRHFCNMNKRPICENCQSHCNTFLMLKMQDGNKRLCTAECLTQFKQKIQTWQPCAMCSTSELVSDMFENRNGDDTVELFCSSSCVMASKALRASESASPGSSATAESSPVITNVVSLAKALAEYRKAPKTTQQGSPPDIQTKVVGHACIQTVAKEVKNKSILCTPLVHNKGVSCKIQTVDTETQTDNFAPKSVILPLPVPVYVPLPMKMYSQYTPELLGLPLPLPVPMFLPGVSCSSEPIVKTTNEKVEPEGETLKSDMKTKQNERNGEENGEKDRQGTRDDGGQEALTDPSSSSCHDVKKDSLDQSLNIQQGSSSDTNHSTYDGQHTHKTFPPVSIPNIPSVSQPELLPSPPPQSPRSQSPHLQQSLEKEHNKNKGRKLKPQSETAKEDTAQRRVSKLTSTKHHRLKCHRGIDVWKRWVQLRASQTATRPGSEHAVKAKENILECSASELNNCLCRFIIEVKRPDGERYSPSSLYYLCLAIQQHLFDNGRMENIFSDRIYKKFSTKFTKILKRYQPSVTDIGYIHSRVEEEYLWDCKQLGAYSPIILLNTLLFFMCKYCGLTTLAQHRQLSFTHFSRCTKTNQDNTKTTFLLFHAPISNEAESGNDGVPATKRKKNENKVRKLKMMENTENPLRCPVRLYEFYLSKCEESLRQRSDLFYLSPHRSCVPSSPLWFSSHPLDGDIMESMLVRILNVREIQQGLRRCTD